jgi:hypothetical protein
MRCWISFGGSKSNIRSEMRRCSIISSAYKRIFSSAFPILIEIAIKVAWVGATSTDTSLWGEA